MVTLMAPQAGAPTLARDGVRAVTDRWALLLRTVAGTGAGAVGLLLPGPTAGIPVLAVLLGWSAFRLLGRGRPGDPRLLAVDIAVILGVALATPLLVSSPEAARSLAGLPAAVVGTASITIVWQLQRWRILAWVAAAVGACALGGSLVEGVSPLDVLVVWFLPVQSLVVWLAMVVLRRGAGRADREATTLAETRAAAVLAAQRRVAEREHWAVLHDTAAATLLMVGTGVPGSASGRVRSQAGRDLVALGDAAPAPDAGVADGADAAGTALAPLLRALLAEGALTVELEAPDDVRAPAGVAAALRDATRELLTNVERHAGTGRVRLRAGRDPGRDGAVWVEVRDEGRGFAPGAAEGRGLRESVRGRLARVGGTVAIRTTPGGGTTVRLRCAGAEPGPRPTPTPAAPRSVVGELVRAFRLVLVVVVVLSAAFRALAARAAAPADGVLETAYVVLAVAVVVLVVGAAVRRRTVPLAATALAAVAAGLDLTLAVRLGPAGVGGLADWTSQSVGWLWFFTLGVAHRGRFLALLCAPFVVRAAVLLTEGDVTSLRVVLVFGLGLVVLQMGGALFLGALESQASWAERLRDERLGVEADRSVADGLLLDFRARSRAMRATTVPLLRELADGSADPTDETTRQRARIEGARLRRLFAEADALDSTLSAEVRSVVEQVERGGVSATLELEVTPPLRTEVRRALLDEPMAALALARTRARVVVQLVAGEVVVSVTTDGPPPPPQPGPQPPGDDLGITTIRATVGDRTWVQSSGPLGPAAAVPGSATGLDERALARSAG